MQSRLYLHFLPELHASSLMVLELHSCNPSHRMNPSNSSIVVRLGGEWVLLQCFRGKSAHSPSIRNPICIPHESTVQSIKHEVIADVLSLPYYTWWFQKLYSWWFQKQYDPLCHTLQQTRQAEASEVVSWEHLSFQKSKQNQRNCRILTLMLTLLRYEAKEAKEKKKICRELTSAILLRYIQLKPIFYLCNYQQMYRVFLF